MSELPPSGLRPPTKIGRPCSNNQPKPAVPQSPKGDGDTSTVRKISNEVAKKKLIDVDDGLSDLSLGRRLSIDRKSSQGSDSLWADVRKLSEAGVRRASDSSIVLTEDTDSFIIGDRVWVGGTKPGQIAYIGETQFAPGDWAGIVLDEPIGKNDGSVAGIRYFQCENRKGIFSRLTRLSRRPLTTNEDGLVTPLPSGTTPVSPGSSTSRISSPISPTGSITMPIGHTGSRGGSELKVGDRVIVMNSNAGSKAGMLRYIGTTQFAAGEWCGVELDDPLGKNDGSVQGVRYFECQDKFGLFAPLHKVSLSPSSSRRPSCAMHHGGTGLKKFGSKESISSVTSMSSVRSAARKPPSHSVSMTTPSLPKRTPLQDIIKEKDIYIEQLLKERDLEKSEGILAASRIEAAEHKCDVLNQELVQFREEVEARDIDMQNFVKQLQEKNKELTILLDDERKHSEDLQFRFEEESINKGEVEVSNLMKEDRISQLEQLLKNEQVQREQLEKESNELEETISKLRVCQEESDDKLSHLKASNEVNEKLVEQLKEQMDMSSVQLEETLSKNRKQEEEIMQLMSTIETSKMLAVQKQDELAHKLTIEIETLNKKIIGFETTIKDNESNKENLIKEINDIKASSSKQIDELKKGHEQELDRLKKLLREKEENLKNIEITSKSTLSELESIKNILKKEKLEGDAKVQGLTLQLNKLQETCVEKEKEIFSLIENLSKVESLVKAKDEEMKGLKESAETTERNFKKEVEALLNELKMKERNISEHTNSFEELELKLRSEIDKTSLNINDKELEINNLKRNIELKQEQHDIELKEKEEKYDELRNLLEMNKKQFGEQIENLSKELSHNQNTIKENEIKMSKLLKQIEDEKNLSLQKEEEIKKSYGRELENLQQKLTETELKATNYENCFKSENVEFNEIKEILKKENESAKLKILQLENELCLIKENCVKKEEEIIDFKKLILEMENNTKLKEEDSLSFKKSFIEAELTFKKQIENLENKIKISENEFKLKEDALHSENLEMKNIVEKTQKECLQFQNKSNNFETYVQENNHKMDFIIKDNENKIKNLMAELELKKTDYELAVKQKDDKIRELEINNQDSDDKQVQLTNKCNDYENQCKAKEVIIENLKKELEERKMAALSNSEETKAYFRNEIETIGKKFAESEVICKKYEYDLENGKKELDKLKAIYERENKENVDKVIDIEKQLQVSKDSCESKSKEILDLKEKISEMETAIQLKNEEAIGLKKCSLKTENDFRKDIEDIQNKCNKNETELKNNENNLKKTIDELNTDIIEGKAKYTELEIRNKQLETDLKEKTNEIDIQMAEKHKLSILLNSLESNKSDHHELLKEKQDKLIEMNEELEKHKLEMIEQHKVLQDLRQRLNESDQRFNTQRELVVQQEHDLSTMRVDSENGQKQISRLTSDIADWKNKLKTSEEKCSLLNEQKFKLEKDLESLKNSMSSKDTVKQHTSATTNGNDEDINYQMQIDFLNSVIVGLQHDKEALNAQILFLETGGVSTTNGNGSGRQITPRLYCDICEVFDAHETEDCPKQISESPPPQQAHKPFPRGYQRPYCEDCEMFGHETGECEDLTF